MAACILPWDVLIAGSLTKVDDMGAALSPVECVQTRVTQSKLFARLVSWCVQETRYGLPVILCGTLLLEVHQGDKGRGVALLEKVSFGVLKGTQFLEGQINPSAFSILFDIANDVSELEGNAQVVRIALHPSVVCTKDRKTRQTHHRRHVVAVLFQLRERGVALDRQVHLHAADEFLKVVLGNGVVRHSPLQGLGDTMGRLASVTVVKFPTPVLQKSLLRRQCVAVIGNIVAVATEGIHRINSITLSLGQKEKSIIKILRVLSRYLATVRICFLRVCVHTWLLVRPPAALAVPPVTAWCC